MAFNLAGLIFSLFKPAPPAGSVNLPVQVDVNGPNTTVSVSAPLATTSVPGLVEPDGTTITVSGGVISAVSPAGPANEVLATPDGSSGAATLRALVAADIPSLPESKVTNLVTDLAAKVPTSRTIATTAPLTGGGDLSANRTLAISAFVASGTGHAAGIVPDPGASAGTTRFLREDATFAVPPGTGATTAFSIAEVALSPSSPGNFTVAHGLGVTPTSALIQMTSGGQVWFQSVRFDSTNLYLVASDSGVTGKAVVFYAATSALAASEVALAPSSPGNFTVAHGLGVTPTSAAIQMTSGGQIWFQSPTRFDSTNLYLVASDAGVTGNAVLFH